MAVGAQPESDSIMPDEEIAGDAKNVRKKSRTNNYSCQVNCLDGSIIKAEVDQHAQGEDLFSKVIKDLSITEKECVGLNFINEKGISLWLDIHKEMKHQIGEVSDVVLNFRFKFYEPEPSRIRDAFLRYLFYLQVRDDLVEGRLKCHENTYAILGSYTVQAELGNFNLHTHDHDYLRDYVFSPEQTSDLVKRVHELHKEHLGQSPAQAELNFLEVAKKIPRYGVVIHKGKDNEGDVEIGVAAIGIYIYRFKRKKYLFRWQIVDAVLYNRRKYTIKLKEGVPKAGEESVSEDNIKLKKRSQSTFVYYFDSATKCKQCYKASVECHTFFRLARPDAPRKKANSLKLGSSFRYSDRTLYQLRYRPDNENPARDVAFTRTPSKRRSTNTPRGSWNPHDKSFKDSDAGPLDKGRRFDEEPQHEEIEINETSPDDDKFDPEEWNVIEKELPDGTIKRYRRRVIDGVPLKKRKKDESPVKTTPVMNGQYYIGQDFDIPIQTYPDSTDSPEVEVLAEEVEDPKTIEPSVNVESELIADFGEQEKMYMEEVEIDETSPEDSWYDPAEWDVVERTMPDGTKKRYRVRLVQADTSNDDNLNVLREKEALEIEEIEINKDDPEDCKYDPNEWDVVEKREPDGSSKRFRRRYFIKTVKHVPTRPSNLLLDEPVMQVKEEDMDEAHPETFNCDEWQVVELLTPNGKTKKVRRTICITRVNLVPKRPSVIHADVPIGVLEELDLDETALCETHAEDMDYDKNEWEMIDKVLSDGKRQAVRRRVIVTKLQYVTKKPCDIRSDEPLAIVEEVKINEASPESFDINEWEVAVKVLPDGTSQPVRRRLLINHIEYVKKKQLDVGSNESHVDVLEIDIDEESPEDYKYNPSEWQVVEKVLPDGNIILVRRQIVITRYQAFSKKPSEIDPNEPLTQTEKVELGECHPDIKNYDPEEWDVEEVVQLDGTSKYIWHRLIISMGEYVYKRPSDVTADEQPVAELEEENVDEENAGSDQYNHKEWELAWKTTPEGKQIRIRRRYMIRRVHITYKKPSDVLPDHRQLTVEEVEIDEENPEDDTYDPNQWEVVEKTSPGCMGKVKRVRRRIVGISVNISHTIPNEISDNDPLKEAIKDYLVDTKDWEIAKITLTNGEQKTGRRRCLVPKGSIDYKRPCEVSECLPLAEVEEVELSSDCLDDPMFHSDEWELMYKTLPDGTKKAVYRRYKIKSYIKEYKKPCDVAPEIPIAVIEEADIESTHIEDGKTESEDGWETCEKVLPDGTKKKIRRRYLLIDRQVTYKKPDAVAADMPHIEVEETLINEEEPEHDKFDLSEWDVVEKVTPSGESKRYRCRIKVTKVAKAYFKPSDVTPSELQDAQVEEVDMDEQLPEDVNPEKWDIIEKTLPDGTTKRVKRRFVVTRVEVVIKKPSTLTEDEPLGILVEEVPFSETDKPNVDYDPTEWDVVEKFDGKNQKVRRRIIVKCTKPYKKALVPDVEEEILVPNYLEESCVDNLLCSKYDIPTGKHGSKKILRRRSIKTTITPVVGGRSVSVSTEEVPKQTEEIEIDESDPRDEKYDSTVWETIEKVLLDGTVKRYRRRIVETVITTVNKKYGDTMADIAPVRLEEFEIDDAHPENDILDPSECEILERTLPDGSQKRYSRRIISSALTGNTRGNETPALWEEVEIDESNPEDEKFDLDEWEVFEKTLPDGSKKRVRRRNINVITVHKKPIAITAGDAPLRVQEVEVDEDLDQEINLDGWEVVEKTLPNGRKKKFHRKILTTIFSCLNEKNEIVDNPPIHIEEVEIYEVSSEDEETFSPKEWEVFDKVLPDGRVAKVHSRSSVTVITPKDTIKLKDKSVAETPVVAKEIELEGSASREYIDPEEWDIIERKLPDGTTKRFHRRIIRKYKKVPRHEQLGEGEEDHLEEFELDETNPEELQKYNTPEWEIVEKTMPDGNVKRFRRKIITTVLTTVTTKTIVVHPDGREEVVNIETTPPGEEATLQSVEDGGLETVTENFMKNLQPEDEPHIQPMLEENLETSVDMTFDMDNLLGEIDQIWKNLSDLSDDESNISHLQPNECVSKGIQEENYILDINEEELKQRQQEEEKRLEDHNATISSIFSIDDSEYSSPIRPIRVYHECQDTLTSANVIEESFEFASADVDFGAPTEEEIVRTASVLKQKNVAGSEPRSSAKDNLKKSQSLDRRYLKRGESVPNRMHSDVPHVGSDDERLLKNCSRAGIEQVSRDRDVNRDVYLSHTGDINAEIMYTLRDVAEVEQGQGGFIQAIKTRHDKLASDELMAIQREAEYPDMYVLPPKCHVPTSTVNYNEVKELDVMITKDAPSGTQIVIIPSELPDDKVGFEKLNSPLTVPYTMQHDIVHNLSNTHVSVVPSSRVTTYTMPTEVITKTITIEGDSSTMSNEELQDIIRRVGSNENILDTPNVSSTHIVSTTTVQKVITGETITVVGDDETEIQKVIDEAIKNATNGSEEMDEGTVVLTAVQQFDEVGSIINTD